MPTSEMGPGEIAARKRLIKRLLTFAALALAGGVIGFCAALVEVPDLNGGVGTFPPAFAIAAAILSATAMIAGSVYFYRSIDEVERTANLLASAVAANVVLIGYPIWYLLWKGGVAGEPIHEVLFLSLFVTAGIAYCWTKFR